MWLLDGDGRTLLSNPRMAELLGRTPEQMEGLSAYDVHDERGKVQFAAHLARARAGDPGHNDLETMYLRLDGDPDLAARAAGDRSTTTTARSSGSCTATPTTPTSRA